ncbi:hypothetical protein [Paraburkholderia hayleyella]|uniref:hypothetical protein n=1 Tax=Paraburkholderia hayleyella TaxID=2152889 RepID=UPI001291BEA1|nr:hypothetical protein [Paraburkholderia hayleyella]
MSAAIDNRSAKPDVSHHAPLDHERHARVHTDKIKHASKGLNRHQASYKKEKTPHVSSLKIMQLREDLERKFGYDDPNDDDSQDNQPINPSTDDLKQQSKLFSGTPRHEEHQQPGAAQPGRPTGTGLGAARKEQAAAAWLGAAPITPPASSMPEVSDFNMGIEVMLMALNSMSIQQASVEEYTNAMNARTDQAKLVEAAITALQNTQAGAAPGATSTPFNGIDTSSLIDSNGQPFQWPPGTWNNTDGSNTPPAGTSPSAITDVYLAKVLGLSNVPPYDSTKSPDTTYGASNDQMSKWVDQLQVQQSTLSNSNAKDMINLQTNMGQYQTDGTEAAQIQEKCYTMNTTIISKI